MQKWVWRWGAGERLGPEYTYKNVQIHNYSNYIYVYQDEYRYQYVHIEREIHRKVLRSVIYMRVYFPTYGEIAGKCFSLLLI